jgi:hypothetical protein
MFITSELIPKMWSQIRATVERHECRLLTRIMVASLQSPISGNGANNVHHDRSIKQCLEGMSIALMYPTDESTVEISYTRQLCRCIAIAHL